MKRFLTTATLLSIIFGLLLMPVSAQDQNGKMQCMEKEMMNHPDCQMGVMNIPGLTDDQIMQIEKLHIAHQKKMVELKSKHELKMIELQEVMLVNPDEKKALSIIEEAGKIDIDIQKSKISNHFAVRKVLTKDQQKFFDLKNGGMSMKKDKGMNNGNCQNKDMGKENCGNCSK
ncbi:TPA: hypothetical protein DCW38_05580 [candidate division WOR-3 bacterium]|jgi:Spy/CpxP family protein refolding chaperone|uniref:Periplasmic heavy metal sensor n=1 Tax=candidate division WOR-3 bacterium TaxID=2052148 RepID=A0A350HAR9_UNCW3|nr:hypothetical protein [candidate division WOR-3 bacterium]